MEPPLTAPLQAILLLRDPVERDYSHFRMALRDGVIASTLLEGLGITDCRSDTALCFVTVLAHLILERTEWQECFGERRLQDLAVRSPPSEEDISILAECVEALPSRNWNNQGHPFLLDGYADAIAAFQDVFRDRLHLIVSEVNHL